MYKQLVDHYKPDWVQHGSSNGLKIPLAKYIWIQLKAIYQAELTYQLNESRKKLTEFCLRLETAVNARTSQNEPTLPYVIRAHLIASQCIPFGFRSVPSETTVPTIVGPPDNEYTQEKPMTIETLSQVTVLSSI